MGKPSTVFELENANGWLTASWHSKPILEAEEGPGYLPTGCERVLTFSIEVMKTGAGYGNALMDAFLSSPVAASADAIFLDPCPGFVFKRAGFPSSLSDNQQIEILQRFYRRFGFKSRPGAARMWRFNRLDVPEEAMPT